MSWVTFMRGKKSTSWRLFKFLFPIALAALYGLLLFLMLNWETFQVVGGGLLVYFVPPAGKESVIPAMVALGIDPMFAALNVALVDIFGAIFLAWNFDLFEKIPGVGWVIMKIEKKSLETLDKNPWMDEVAFVGLIIFVIVPFQGSGAVGASILGNIIAMKPEKVLLAVEIGAIVGTLAIAYLSSVFIALIFTNILYAFVLVALLAVFFLMMMKVKDRAVRKHEEKVRNGTAKPVVRQTRRYNPEEDKGKKPKGKGKVKK